MCQSWEQNSDGVKQQAVWYKILGLSARERERRKGERGCFAMQKAGKRAGIHARKDRLSGTDVFGSKRASAFCIFKSCLGWFYTVSAENL